ncbi:MAG TPA: chromosome segregation protein SMC [Phycisphaerae bacterium]|nr:chromosome segregation protein SMC [Phycisphaerae bacterium]
MYLKRLSCFGFKSFADKTDFDFKPGITGIVGPNGCGKSNVVDAIKWVLGDQSPKSLRGKQMQDVIFNGSGTRRSASMAQVDLTFDNSDRRLPIEADEVCITRRLYRSNESEYLINGEVRRLKDVKELFMDTGIGVGGYSIIEQGQVALLLQANPSERRLIFEEAAGISRYKARKKEAERKLERVEQNLLRIEDIVEELEKRLRSIKYQAGKARNFQEYDKQLREKRATYSLAEYHKHTIRRAELEQVTAQLSDQATELRTIISGAEARAAALDRDVMVLDAEVRQIEQQILGNASEITANRERASQSRQRVEELAAARTRAQQRLAAERQRSLAWRQQIEGVEEQADSVESELAEANAAVDRLSNEDRELARQLASLQARSEDEKAGIIDLMRRTAQLNNEISSLQQRRQQLEDNKSRLTARLDQVRAELEQLMSVRAEIAEKGEQIAARLADHQTQLAEKREEASRLDAARAELNQQIAAAKEYRSGLMSRRQLLSDLDRQLEGVDAGVREVLRRMQNDPSGETFRYVKGMVADLVTADVSNAMLIETALGDYDQYLVVESSRAFLDDASLLAEFPGRVRAICLDRIPPFVNGRDFSQQPGFVACAMDLVKCAPEAEGLIKHLLGRTIVVETLADAERMAAQNPPAYRYVTRAGELLDSEGRCQLGPAGAGAGLISRKSELREIEHQIAEVDGRIAVMSERLERTTADILQLERTQEELRAAIAETNKAQIETNAARQANDNAIGRLTHEQPLLTGEIEAIDVQIRDAAERAARSAEAVAQLEQENIERENRVKEIAEQIDTLQDRRAQLAERVTEAKVAVGQLAQRRGMLADRLRGLRNSLQASEEAVRASAHEAEDAVHRLAQSERAILSAQARLAELYSTKEQLDRHLMDCLHRREQIRYEAEQLAARLKSGRVELEQAESELHARQMELQEVNLRVETLLTRVRDELGIDLVEVYATYEHAEQDWAALEAEIEELKEKIRRLGNVNLDAIAEQEELEKRATFLASQRDDLRQSRKQLEELIEQLNNECRERFVQTFETVRGHFQELFRRLFGGGKADIMLEQPPEGQPLDVLEAGIDIMARPPGKENRNITLLSGGEKTMTAIALLLAIFRSRPSPFTVLDEVDAALDEANNERFNRIICDFLDHSQFLIITHSKRTMTIADVLYGVTMQEAGVSKRVGVRFDTEDDKEAAVA